MSAEERSGHPPGLPEDGQAVLPSKDDRMTVILPQALSFQALPWGAPKAQRALLTPPPRGAVPAPGIFRTDAAPGAGLLLSTDPAQPASEGILFPNKEAAPFPSRAPLPPLWGR